MIFQIFLPPCLHFFASLFTEFKKIFLSAYLFHPARFMISCKNIMKEHRNFRMIFRLFPHPAPLHQPDRFNELKKNTPLLTYSRLPIILIFSTMIMKSQETDVVNENHDSWDVKCNFNLKRLSNQIGNIAPIQNVKVESCKNCFEDIKTNFIWFNLTIFLLTLFTFINIAHVLAEN